MFRASPRSRALACVAVLGAGFLGTPAAHAEACAGRIELEAEYYSFPVPGSAHCVAAGDWNEDGRPDVAVVHSGYAYTNPAFSILFGQGGFHVGSRREMPVDIAPRWVVVHDMDRDGHLDLVVTGDRGTVILSGDGTGSFRQTEQFPESGSRATVGDVDGDGTPDIALAGPLIKIILRGSGQLLELQGSTTVVLADFDRDGDLDLAAASARVWLNDGRGHLSGPTSYLNPSDCYPGHIAAGDVNGDGNLDLFGATTVSGGGGGCDMLLLGRGDGTFRSARFAVADASVDDSRPLPRGRTVEPDGEPSTAHPNDTPQSPRHVPPGPHFVVLADFNGDGRADPIRIGGDTGEEMNGQRTSGAEMACAADVDGDGKLDIVVAGYDAVGVHPGNGDGSFRRNLSTWFSDSPRSVVLADLDGDGARDVAVTGSEGEELVVTLTAPDGGFERIIHNQIYPRSGDIEIADFDGDGRADLLDAWDGLYLGNGDGTFRTPAIATPAFGVPGDFDEDGHMDIASPKGHDVQFFLGNGDGTFRSGSTIAVEAVALQVADVDHDGHLDFVTSALSFAAVVYGRGDGTAAEIVPLPVLKDRRFGFVSMGDLDGDGLQDFIIQSLDGADVYLGRGRTFARSPYKGAPAFPVVGDLNGDGIADLMAGGVWVGHGDGTFDPPDVLYGPGGSTHLDDRNGDGLDDVVVAGSYDAHNDYGTLTLIMNRTLRNHAPATAGARATVALTWPPNGEFADVGIAGVTDADGDPVSIQCLGVTQDEPVSGGPERAVERGSGKHEACADAMIASSGHARVRLARDGSGNGRVYEIAYSASDGCGGTSLGHVRVEIPHDPGKPCVDDGQRFNSLACGSAFAVEGTDAIDRPLSVDRVAPGRWAIRYSLAAPAEIQLDVFDVLGRRVAALESGRRAAGVHEAVWTPTAGHGVFFARLMRDGRKEVRRFVTLP